MQEPILNLKRLELDREEVISYYAMQAKYWGPFS
jgi:hypothetical protein